MGRLDGKIAIISGGARGQGAAEARLFVAEGARVVIGDVLDDLGTALADELGDAARFVHLDVRDETAWATAVATAETAFGAVSVLVNNAGIIRFIPLADTTEDAFREVFEINQLGPFLGMRAVLPSMTRAGGGSIVNVSSTNGLWGHPGTIAYTGSKWAVRGMTKTAALELGPLGIRVNSIHPGAVATDMIRPPGLADDPAAEAAWNANFAHLPIGRPGRAEEIARLALFLASDESSYSTGSEFVADGGMTAGPGHSSR